MGSTLAVALILAATAGLDVFLTLVLIALAPLADWTVPAGLEQLSTPLVAALAGGLWFMEFLAERSRTVTVFWHLVQSVARPVAAGLLTSLVLGGGDVTGALAVILPISMAAMAFLIHTAKTGWLLLNWFDGGRRVRPFFLSMGEDAVVLGLVVLSFDAPRAGGALVLLGLMVLVVLGRALLRAGAFSHYLAWSRSWGSLLPFRWYGEDDLPGDLAGEVAAIPRPLGHRLKAARAAGMRLPVGGLFRPGWIVVGPADPRWVCRTLSGPRMHVLEPNPSRIIVRPLFFQFQIGEREQECLVFPRGGPTVEAVVSEIGASAGRLPPPEYDS